MASRKLAARAVTCLALVSALVVIVVGEAPPGANAAGGGRDVVRLDSGWVRGRASAQHVTFSGIPYAQPPVGERRWTPPQPPPAWAGVRDATAPASPCAQMEFGEDGSSSVTGDEDCLYLNVTAPRGARPGPRRPVMVWLHGGGFVSGAGSEYGAGRLVADGDVVVVTVNYRLGPLGFLSSPVLDGEGDPSGSYGLQDQAAALQWVQRNAARFGGDPGNVTLFGQSAGARSVCAHLAAPGSRGLFHKAILQSGPCANALVSKPVADERGARATVELGCASSDDVTACLRGRPVADVLETLPDQGNAINDEYADEAWMPVVGTPVLPDQPIEALARGSGAGVPLLVGSARDEMYAFVGFRYDAVGNPLTEPRYRALLEEAFGPAAGDVLARYPLDDHPSPALALARVLSDWGGGVGACPMLRTAQVAARHSPVFAYELAEDSGQIYEGFPLGAYHSWDLPFLWEDLSIPGSDYPELTDEQRALSRQMVDYWTTFARTGDPNTRGSVPWPQHGASEPTVLSLSAGDSGIAPVAFAQNHQCDFWSRSVT